MLYYLFSVFVAFFDVQPVQSLLYPLHYICLICSNYFDLPLYQINYLFCFLVSFILAIIFRFFTNTTLRHTYSTVCGVLFVIFVHGNDVYHGLCSVIIVYIIMYLLPNKFGFYLVWILSFGYLMLNQFYIQYLYYTKDNVNDYTYTQMFLTLKMCAFAANILDGKASSQSLSSHQQKKRIEKYPSLLEYLSWNYYFSAVLIGPFFEYNDYIKFIQHSLENPNKRVWDTYQEQTWFFYLCEILLKIFVLSLLVIKSYDYGVELLYDEKFLSEASIFYKLYYIWVCGILLKTKYYFLWTLVEGSVLVSGFGFNGYDHQNKLWNRGYNGSFIGVEFAQNLSDVVYNWNKKTERWMRYYVMYRIVKRTKHSKKSIATTLGLLMTIIIYALWHGFYLVNYYFIICVVIFNITYIYAIKLIQPTIDSKPLIIQQAFSLFCVLLPSFSLNYLCVRIQVMIFTNSYYNSHFLVKQ
eukprot:TRINITY_DN8003_c0_g1_i2.p1 TRINITY_DN8003_c0_g1~~TRINITY_DN8003_c0_g1_i2.p1  ORF type:complete len:467 (-),score=36.63 TRINITY_DN8003_c0_g1_i2:40-1440(-)